MKETKGLITISIGEKYVKQAKYLAYSCMLNSPHTIRAVITDQPECLKNFYDIVIPFETKNDDPFSVKTRLYQYAPFEKTLFLDADTLVASNLDSYFEKLNNYSFAYEGKIINSGEWYADIKGLCETLNLPGVPKFNSGMLLFKKTEFVEKIFTDAYYYFMNHKKEGITIPYFRGKFFPDEPFFSISFAKNNLNPIEDYGRFSRTLIDANRIRVNIVKGYISFYKNNHTYFPLTVHLCGKFGNIIYIREKIRLFFYFNSLTDILFTGFLSLARNFIKN